MVFSSLEFIFFFLPVVLIGYLILPEGGKPVWLFAASLFFYAWGEPRFFLLFAVSFVLNWAAGLQLERAKKGRKLWLTALILLNLLPLGYYKYLNIGMTLIRRAIPAWTPKYPEAVLPLGISFFTFQNITYLIDVYRGMPAERSWLQYGLYAAFFPQLLQGPILRYGPYRETLRLPKPDWERLYDGVRRFLEGLSKKVLLANTLSEAADAAFTAKNPSVGLAWLGILAYSLQLYFDFSGYSDMAVGLGKMFGFELPENFDYPYMSQTVGEFWRRWHITLGAWFRDYLYFPLGGSRGKTKARTALNLMIVWLATGIWHGAEKKFILWGLMHGSFIVMEKLTDLPKKLEGRPLSALLYRGVVLLVAGFGWMLFRVQDITHAGNYFRACFRLNGNQWLGGTFKFNAREYIVFFVFGILCSTPLFGKLRGKISAKGEKAAVIVSALHFLVLIILGTFSVSSLVMNSQDPFVYFNF